MVAATPSTHIFDSKDNLPRELQFIQPLNASSAQMTRIMVSPRRAVSVSDATPQSAALSSAAIISFSANDIAAGSWSTPQTGVGVIFENMRALIQAADASGKLQINLPVRLSINTWFQLPLSANPCPLPATLPAINTAAYAAIALEPMAPWLPSDPSFTNGPTAVFGLINTDATAAHTYYRIINYVYRYIYDIDYTKERIYVTGTLT